ncbi:MAG: hypothetical protein LQ350_004774 [Teloschistes chrysophthalmus]|nr:MAG: hypothetical protein LQ350_004774 [Niorma chrysophthalma]
MATGDSPTSVGNMSSPARSQYGEPAELTPRSKVKAMMAAIGSESDSDAPVQKEEDRKHTKAWQSAVKDRSEDMDNSDTTDASDVPRRLAGPRGKLAARLQRKPSATSPDAQADDQSSGDAYSRMKKRLMKRSPKSPIQGRSRNNSETPQLTDEDDALPVLGTRRRQPSQPDLTMFPSPSASSKTPRRSSPGLFVTPVKEKGLTSQVRPTSVRGSQGDDSGSELPEHPQANGRFLALVARKEEERKGKARAEEDRRAKRRERFLQERRGGRDRDGRRMRRSSDESDGPDAKRLSQHVKPTRKASKRALEEMNRETQRMNRNMQLAHQARTKKKITKESLFARFNFRTQEPTASGAVPATSSSAVASSNPASDAEATRVVDSPPTSPVTAEEGISKAVAAREEPIRVSNGNPEVQSALLEDELPDLGDVIAQSQEIHHLKENRLAGDGIVNDAPKQRASQLKIKMDAKKSVRVRESKRAERTHARSESGSDLEILPEKPKPRKLDVFDRLPAQKAGEGRSMQKLRALAHLTSPDKPGRSTKARLSFADMQNSLQKRARQQAARATAERVQNLKDRGVIVQTAEEREKDQAELENLLEKARREAVELKQQEKDASKREAKAKGQEIPDDSSGEDEDYEENDADESDMELSGSDEDNERDLDASQANSGEDDNGLIDDQASEASSESGDIEPPHEGDKGPDIGDWTSDAEDEPSRAAPKRRRRNNIVEDDDDDAEMQGQQEAVSATQDDSQEPINPGLPMFADAPMGLTQAFAATMADSQTQPNGHQPAGDLEQDSLAFLGAPPEPEISIFEMDDSLQMIADSQEMNATESQSQTKIAFDFSQSQIHGTDAGTSASQMSQIPDPSQDVGFTLSSPAPARFASIPPSTVDTVILPQTVVPDSPAVKKKGRLRRKIDMAMDDESETPYIAGHGPVNKGISPDAFDVLKKGAKKASTTVDFDKKKSKAQEMVEEQAQESEDEYAGLGGASDEESGGEMDEDIQKMIEQGDVDVDEGQLAAFYADKERASDEKAVEKLFKDINNGMLRRKRGADFDLSDSEDDDEARRRRKRKEFAKMRKALLENENVGKIAEDPKKMAFLRAIEDREDQDDDLDFLDQPEDSQPDMIMDSQEGSGPQPQESAATALLGKRKRPLTESGPDIANRAPATSRRTGATAKKPTSLADIRASVSFLIESPDAMPLLPPSSSPIASDHENDENDEYTTFRRPDPKNQGGPFASRRVSNPVIDRLSLKRASSASTSTSTTSARLAFQDPSKNIFKVPSLLRRSTTSSSFNNNSQDANGISTLAETERSAGGGEKEGVVRRGGTKRSSVNWVRRVGGVGGVGVGAQGEEEGRRMVVRREGSLRGLGVGRWE